MRILSITAGAAGMYCGNCLRDHALALAMRDLGDAENVDLTLVPTYTPLLTDSPQGDEVHGSILFFNGVRTYLSQNAGQRIAPVGRLDCCFQRQANVLCGDSNDKAH